MEALFKLFDMDKLANVGSFDQVDEDARKKADLLVTMLRVRLSNLMSSRIENESRRNDPIWDWASKNLPVCAAYMILAGHVKADFHDVPESESLLATGTNNFIPHERFPTRHGVYLQHDIKLCVFIRSGKKTGGDGFSARIAQHESGCKAAKATSNFYSLYPSNSTAR